MEKFVRFDKSEIEQSISTRFEQQVCKRRQNTAVRTARYAWSYDELNRRANRIAHGIITARGKPGNTVVLLLDQGAVLVSAILGVLKAGRIYVPLDASHELDQLSAAIRAAGADLILTDVANRSLAETLAARGGDACNIDDIAAGMLDDDPRLSLAPDTPAYIFFTSGSTGRPKGVVDDHRNVLHNVMRYTNTLRIAAGDRLTLIQSPSFSGTVSSLFCALLNGATIYPFDLRRNGIEKLAQWIETEEISVYHSVPTIFSQLVTCGRRLSSLRIIRLEGDQCALPHVALYKARFGPACTLVNGLGATETGLTRQFFIRHDSEVPGPVVPIGYATEDMEALIFDESGREVAAGEVGEIVIRSRYLARGYWRQPELTRQVFQPDPGDPALRLYRTGDVGRARPDGCLDYLGRKDFQVKIRGQRVDAAEVESALNEINLVKEAVEQAEEDRRHGTRLVAYVVPAGAGAPTVTALRRALADRLPALMIPSVYVIVDSLPLDDNGKVARQSLPNPESRRPELDIPFLAPRTATESAIAAVWRQVLEIEDIGVRDPFLDLGGDSLQAMEVALRLEKTLGTALPLAIVFEAATVEDMAAAVDAGVASRCLVAIQPDGAERPFFCVHSHRGHVINLAGLARHLGPDRPFFGLQSLLVARPEESVARIEDMAAHYIGEMRRQQPVGPYAFGGFCFGGLVAYEMAHQLKASGQEVALLALIDTYCPIGGRTPSPGEWLARHRQRTRELAGKNLFRYLGKRLLNVTTQSAWRLRLRLSQPIWRLVTARGRRFPRLLGGPTVVHTLLDRGYRPKPYDGRTVLFAAELYASAHAQSHSGWEDLIGSGFVLEPVPAAQHEFMLEPHVGELGRRLRRHLAAAEAGE